MTHRISRGCFAGIVGADCRAGGRISPPPSMLPDVRTRKANVLFASPFPSLHSTVTLSLSVLRDEPAAEKLTDQDTCWVRPQPGPPAWPGSPLMLTLQRLDLHPKATCRPCRREHWSPTRERCRCVGPPGWTRRRCSGVCELVAAAAAVPALRRTGWTGRRTADTRAGLARSSHPAYGLGLAERGKFSGKGRDLGASGVAARRGEVSTSSPPTLGSERLGRCADCGLTRRNDALSTDEAESRLAPIESNGGFLTTEDAPTAAG